MIMWIAAIVLVALTISLGYRQGATRAAISFIGLIAGVILAVPLSPMFNFIFNFITVHPAVPPFITPIIAFFVVSWVFKIVAEFVHRKVDYHYRYHVPDAQRAYWERMHRRVGASLGALNGIIYFIVFALVVDVGGYFAIQAGGAESGSKALSFVSKAAEDLKATKMDLVVSPFNPAPKRYYEISDVLGLLYQNRGLKQRVENYPVFAAMADRPVFKDLGADAGAQKLLDSAPLSDLLANDKISAVLTNRDLFNEILEKVDIADLNTYLTNGVSPKFADQLILGRWAYDYDSTLQLNKAARPDVGAIDWAKMKKELRERFDNSIFIAYYDNKAVLNLSPAMEGKGSPMQAVPALPGRQPANRQTNYVALWLTTNATYSASGKWSGSAPKYLVSLGNKNGTATSEAALHEKNRKISFKFEGKQLAFDKIPD